MESLNSSRFFNLLLRVEADGNPEGRKDWWTDGEVFWHRARHSFSTHAHSFQIEALEVERTAAPAWRILAVREYWWFGPERVPARSARWVKLLSGSGKAVLRWFQTREGRC